MFTVIPRSPNRCLWCHGLLCFWCQRSPSEDWTRQEHLLRYELWFQNATVLLHMMLWSHDRKRPHVFIRMLHASCFSSLLPRWCSGRWIVSLFFCLMLWFLTFIHTFRDVNRRRVTVVGFVRCRSEQCIMNRIPAKSFFSITVQSLMNVSILTLVSHRDHMLQCLQSYSRIIKSHMALSVGRHPSPVPVENEWLTVAHWCVKKASSAVWCVFVPDANFWPWHLK